MILSEEVTDLAVHDVTLSETMEGIEVSVDCPITFWEEVSKELLEPKGGPKLLPWTVDDARDEISEEAVTLLICKLLVVISMFVVSAGVSVEVLSSTTELKTVSVWLTLRSPTEECHISEGVGRLLVCESLVVISVFVIPVGTSVDGLSCPTHVDEELETLLLWLILEMPTDE